jgi:hypothetical protein
MCGIVPTHLPLQTEIELKKREALMKPEQVG